METFHLKFCNFKAFAMTLENKSKKDNNSNNKINMLKKKQKNKERKKTNSKTYIIINNPRNIFSIYHIKTKEAYNIL